MTSKTSQVLCWSWGWRPGRRAGGLDATLAQPDGRSSGRSASMLPLLTLPTMLDAFDPALWFWGHAMLVGRMLRLTLRIALSHGSENDCTELNYVAQRPPAVRSRLLDVLTAAGLILQSKDGVAQLHVLHPGNSREVECNVADGQMRGAACTALRQHTPVRGRGRSRRSGCAAAPSWCAAGCGSCRPGGWAPGWSATPRRPPSTPAAAARACAAPAVAVHVLSAHVLSEVERGMCLHAITGM